MARLTKAHLAFLKHHDVPLSRVFDATGVGPRKGDYGAVMSELELWIAYNVTPCRAEGHTLRDRKGNCVQCKTSNIAYLRRHDEAGEVYVFYSSSGRLTKVGSSKNPRVRIRNTIERAYGGCSDWEIQYSRSTPKAGRVEFLAHRKLEAHRVSATYYDHGHNIECLELFRCDVKTAIGAVENSLKDA